MTLNLADDCEALPPSRMAERLAQLSGGAVADYYGNGGAVACFEQQIADHLGKQRAVMFATGTLANLLGLRRLAGGTNARILVHRDSHLFNDSGENLTSLGGLTMVPLAGAGAGFSAAQVKAEIERAASARVATRIGAVAVESPSRRLQGRRFGPDLPGVVRTCQDAGTPLFLDGARMLIECAFSGQSPAEIAAPFDLVYMSLYKYLGAPFGCVLAGSSALLDDIYHDRRRFGGGLYQMWPAAVLAADALPNQAAIWAAARGAGNAVCDGLRAQGVEVIVPDHATNVILLPGRMTTEAVSATAQALDLKLLPPSDDHLPIKINESWTTRPAGQIVTRITELAQRLAT